MAFPQADAPETRKEGRKGDGILVYRETRQWGGGGCVSGRGSSRRGSSSSEEEEEPTPASPSHMPEALDRLLSLQPARSRALFTAKSTELHLQEDGDGEFWELHGPSMCLDALSGCSPEEQELRGSAQVDSVGQPASASEFHDCHEEVLEDSAHIDVPGAGVLKGGQSRSKAKDSTHSTSTTSSDSCATECRDDDELAATRGVLDDLDSASSAGYTFNKEDMVQLQKESDSLQLLVSQLSSALEEADDQKSHLEVHLRYAVQQQPAVSNGLSRKVRMRSAKERLPAHIEARYSSQLQQQLLQSRAALVQSINAQNAMRDRVARLRASGDALRSALAATEAELDIYKTKVELLAQREGPAVLKDLEQQVSAIECWRRGAKKAVEDTGAASLYTSGGGESVLERELPSNAVMEAIYLREENENLTRALADLSIRFAEADNEHAQTKRALVRAQSELALLNSTQDAPP